MIKTIHCFFLLILLQTAEKGQTQQIISQDKSNPKKLVTIPGTSDSSAKGVFCICKIVTFAYGNEHRTDAILASNSAENSLSINSLKKSIDKELQQALWFFDSYKVTGQYASPVRCSILYKYLQDQNQEIKRYTFIVGSYAVR
jgi:hypothetical protein